MTLFILVRKLLRDLRWSLLAVALLLGAFQVLWAKITERILSKLSPFFTGLANQAGLERNPLAGHHLRKAVALLTQIQFGRALHIVVHQPSAAVQPHGRRLVRQTLQCG